MDDDDSKVRRNLAVTAGLVILAAWLEVPLDQLLEKISGLHSDKTVGGSGISPLRIWCAVLAILTYLALRYRFAQEGRRFARAFRRERVLLMQRYVKGCVERALLRYSRKEKDSPVFYGELRTFVNKATKDMEAGLHGELLPRPIVTASSIQLQSTYGGNAGLTFVWQRATSQAASTGAVIGFEVVGGARWLVVCRATIEALIYSRTSTQHVFPVALWLAAIGISLLKITASLLV